MAVRGRRNFSLAERRGRETGLNDNERQSCRSMHTGDEIFVQLMLSTHWNICFVPQNLTLCGHVHISATLCCRSVSEPAGCGDVDTTTAGSKSCILNNELLSCFLLGFVASALCPAQKSTVERWIIWSMGTIHLPYQGMDLLSDLGSVSGCQLCSASNRPDRSFASSVFQHHLPDAH